MISTRTILYQINKNSLPNNKSPVTWTLQTLLYEKGLKINESEPSGFRADSFS